MGAIKKSRRRELMLEVELYKEKIYLACKDKALTTLEVKEMFKITFHQTKNYLASLEENKHLDKIKFYSKPKKCWVVQYKSTDYEFKPKTELQIEEHLQKIYGGRTLAAFGEGKHDNLIANNPNLRKVKLFDEKDHDYFRQPLRKTGKTAIGSSFSLYDSFDG